MPITHPVLYAACSFILASALVIATDRYAMPPTARGRAWTEASGPGRIVDLAARLAVILPVFLVFFAISWRPLYAVAGTLSFFVIFTGISRAKFSDIREPLVFSDIALVALVFRHRNLFRADWLGAGFVLAALTYIFGASALFMIYEPALLPQEDRLALVVAALTAAVLPWMLLFVAPVRRAAARLAQFIIAKDAIASLTVRLGTFAAVIWCFLAWLADRPSPAVLAAARPSAALPEAGSERPLLIVWQSESFVDMRHHGVPVDLPHLDALRRRALAFGRMSSIFEGGYTLRIEFSVLTGMKPAELGPDASYPYLRADAFADVAWPYRLRRAGWATRFIHPYDPVFFSRDRALPKLGFETLAMLDAFDHDPRRDGPYVTDLELTRRVLALADQDHDRPGQFVFAASIENHGPWAPGRHGDRTAALEIYTGLLETSDAALGFLVAELDRMERPVWLIFYGDHAPLLKSFADPFPDPRTDYVIAPLGRAARPVSQAAPSEMAPWDLIATAVSHMGGRGAVAQLD